MACRGTARAFAASVTHFSHFHRSPVRNAYLPVQRVKKAFKGGLVILHGLAYSIHTSLFCFLTCTALHYEVRCTAANLIATDFVLRSEPHSTATVPRHSPDLLYHVRICQHAHRRPSSTTLYTQHAAPQSSTQMRRARGWLFELDAATW